MTISFAELGLSTPVLKAVEKMGFTSPTPVQEQAIPELLAGHDVCAAAATGTGKTAAFLLPTLSKLGHYEKGKGPRMLVVSPTRELAEQIGRACLPISRQTKHFMLTVTGGTKYGPQIKQLRRGIDILIATPGRLNDLRERGVVDLSSIEVLVLDEADRMLDMGFWPDIESILEEVPEKRQTALFSATFDHSVMGKVNKVLNDPVMIEIAHHGETAATVNQYVLPIDNKKKPELLQATLNEMGAERVIVFTRTKRRADECAKLLHDADFVAESIHSDKNQNLRRRILKRFSKGDTNILVATDVLARGIDVPDVDYVVNYDLPDAAEDYVHRIGRTGRAGHDGFAVSFSTRESRNELNAIQKLIDKKLPIMPLESFEVDPTILEPKKKKKEQATPNAESKHEGKRKSRSFKPHGKNGARRYAQGGKSKGNGFGKGGRSQNRSNGNGNGDSRPNGRSNGRPGSRPNGRPNGRPSSRPNGRKRSFNKGRSRAHA